MKKSILIFCLLGIILISAVTSLKWRQISDAIPTVTEINFVDGVTSAIQTQLNSKLDTAIADARYLQIANGDTAAYYTVPEVDILNQESLLLRQMRFMGFNPKSIPLFSTTYLNGYSPITDGSYYMNLHYFAKETTISAFQVALTTQGVYTADEYNGIEIYSVAGVTLSKITGGATANDGDLWKASANTTITKSLPAPITVPAGMYAICFMYSASAQTTAPQLLIFGAVTVYGTLTPSGIKPSASKATQITLPTNGTTITSMSGNGTLWGVWPI